MFGRATIRLGIGPHSSYCYSTHQREQTISEFQFTLPVNSDSFHQPHPGFSILLTHLTMLTSDHLYVDSPSCHSQLKTHLFHKSFLQDCLLD